MKQNRSRVANACACKDKARVSGHASHLIGTWTHSVIVGSLSGYLRDKRVSRKTGESVQQLLANRRQSNLCISTGEGSG